MTRKEKQKLLLNVLGLKVGDIIEITDNGIEKLEIAEYEDNYCLKRKDGTTGGLYSLIIYDFTKIIPKKKKGDLMCSDFNSCRECPLYTFFTHCQSGTRNILYDILKSTKEYYKLDTRIYNAYKSILDEELEDEK